MLHYPPQVPKQRFFATFSSCHIPDISSSASFACFEVLSNKFGRNTRGSDNNHYGGNLSNCIGPNQSGPKVIRPISNLRANYADPCIFVRMWSPPPL